ncbi:MAG: methyltransferase domain-containing protein [Proteobacteria bacterium]|nr:methyltransferase domain-containing protein [Pseudomonadota bacterium]
MNDYSFGVGREGAERLDLVNDVLGPYSRSFLLNAGLREGISVLEVGCGSGNMTVFLAEQVGPQGRVIAVDSSPQQIKIAGERCSRAGHRNVSFVCARAEALDLPGQRFDLACCRLVLMHLREPGSAVARMAGLLVPGGTLACEEPTTSTLHTLPRCEVFHRVNDLFLRAGKMAGIDLDIGDRLFPMIVEAGLRPAIAHFVQPMVPIRVAKALVLTGVREGLPAALRAGIVTRETADEILREIADLHEDDSSYYAVPRYAQVAGTRGTSSDA